MWEFFIDPIVGIGLGAEFIENEVDGEKAFIFDLLFIRFVFYKVGE